MGPFEDEAMNPADLDEFTPEGNTARIEAVLTVSNKYGRTVYETGRLLAERRVMTKDAALLEFAKVKNRGLTVATILSFPLPKPAKPDLYVILLPSDPLARDAAMTRLIAAMRREKL